MAQLLATWFGDTAGVCANANPAAAKLNHKKLRRFINTSPVSIHVFDRVVDVEFTRWGDDVGSFDDFDEFQGLVIDDHDGAFFF